MPTTEPNILAQLEAAARIRGRRRLPRPPRPQHPDPAIRWYRKVLRDYVDGIRKIALDMVSAQYPKIVESRYQIEPDLRTGADDWGDDFAGMMIGFSERVNRDLTPPNGWESVANTAGTMTADRNAANWHALLKRTLGVDVIAAEPWLNPEIKAFSTQNVSLISSVTEEAKNRVEQVVVTGLRNGTRVESIRRELVTQFGITRRRAELIARDQIGKLNAQITQARQKALGVEEYVWSGIMDERERPEHVAREGKRFRWDQPPEDGHPGEAINCRCTAIPVMDHLLDFSE